MKILNLEKDNRKYRVYISPDGYGHYDYKLYEMIPKKHWWSWDRRYIGRGLIWNDIEKEIITRIEKERKKEDEINRLAEQFNNL